jgi:hypothetical protein
MPPDGGIMVLREVEQCLRVADRMAACLVDPRTLITDPPVSNSVTQTQLVARQYARWPYVYTIRSLNN